MRHYYQTNNTELGSKEKSVMDPALFAPSSSLYAASSRLLETNIAMLLLSLSQMDYANRIMRTF